jgi:hypothetical protein
MIVDSTLVPACQSKRKRLPSSKNLSYRVKVLEKCCACCLFRYCDCTQPVTFSLEVC